MKEQKRWLERLMDHADLQTEPLPHVPLVELAGEHRVLIENHCGVTEYSQEQIKVRVCYGLLCIGGRKLEVARMTREQLVITGRIDCITLIRRNG